MPGDDNSPRYLLGQVTTLSPGALQHKNDHCLSAKHLVMIIVRDCLCTSIPLLSVADRSLQ